MIMIGYSNIWFMSSDALLADTRTQSSGGDVTAPLWFVEAVGLYQVVTGVNVES